MNRIFFLLTLFALACTRPSQQTESPPPPLESSLLAPTLEAHGGLDKWRSYGSLSFYMLYERGDNIREENILTDLHSRHERIEGTDYVLGFDGTEYWEKLPVDMKSRNPKFQVGLQFYFFALPFVLADPGVNLESLGKRSIKGQEYEVVKATFGSDVGVAPEDQYLLYLDPESHQLVYLLYSVTYFDQSRAERYNAAHYVDWQSVGSLRVSAEIHSYVWDNDAQKLGELRGVKTFRDVKFGEERPDAGAFSNL